MMIEVEKKDLISLLSKTQNIVEKRNTMPILVNVLLESDEKKLKVFATYLEVSLTDEIPVIREKKGRVAVSATNLFDIVKELAEAPIVLTKKENTQVTCEFLKNHILVRFGVPIKIVDDNDTYFSSREMSMFSYEHGITLADASN